MDNNNSKVCYLCYSVLKDNFGTFFETTWKGILTVIFPDWPFHISDNSQICEECNNILQGCKLFKQRCVDTENKISSYRKSRGSKKVYLQDLHINENENEGSVRMSHTEICRLCCQSIKNDRIIDLESHHAGIIEKLLPEMDLDSVKKPVICQDCSEMLNRIDTIYHRCARNGKNYNTDRPDLTKSINLNDIEIKSEIIETDFSAITDQVKYESMDEDEGFENIIYKMEPTEDSFIESPQCNQAMCKTITGFSHKHCMELKCGIFPKQDSSQNDLRPNQEQNEHIIYNDLQNNHYRPEFKCEWVSRDSNDLFKEVEMPFMDEVINNEEQNVNTAKIKSEYTPEVSITDLNSLMEQSPCNNVKPIVDTWSNYSPLFKRNKKTNFFHCPCCEYTSKWQQDFKRHFFENHDRNYIPFQCNLCPYKSKRKTQLRRHINTEHNTNFKPFQCTECSYKTKWKTSLKRHVRIEHDQDAEIFSCTECNYRTKQKSSLKHHVETQHAENRIIYECPECSFKSKSEGYLKHHIRSHNSVDVLLNCTECNFKTRWKQYLTKHMRHKHKRNEKNYECAVCGYKTTYRASIIQHVHKIHSKETLECEDCGYKSKSKSVFERHVKIKHKRDVLTFKCTVCQFKTDRHKSLQRHIELRHNKKPVLFECSICNQKLKTKQSLREHTNMMHTLDFEMIECKRCPFKTKWKKVLERHMRLKHDENCQKYKCQFCSYEAKLKSNLKLHVNSKHNDCRMIYQCGFCETKTVSEVYLKKHVRTEHSDVCVIKKEEF